jgi:site-specific recombinase XerD
MFLLDTGASVREVLNIDIQDVDLVSGATLIERGKGAKPRTVFLGKASRKAMRV